MQKIKDIEKLVPNDITTAIVIRKNNMPFFHNLNINQEFKAASLIKLGIALYIKDRQLSTLNDQIEISQQDMVGGAGIINRLHVNRWQVKDLIDLMLSLSDNTATNALISFYGIKEINDYLCSKYTGIQLKRYLMYNSNQENIINAVAIMDVFEQLLNGNDDFTKFINNVLTHQTARNKLVSISNPAFISLNKTGELLHEQHDIARFENANETLDCCVLTRVKNYKQYQESILMMQQIGKILTNDFL